MTMMNSNHKQHAIALIATVQLCFAFAPKHTIIESSRSSTNLDNRADGQLGLSTAIIDGRRKRYNNPQLSGASSEETSSTSVYEYDCHGQRFDRETFAKSNCWGRRPFLMRGAFDPEVLLESQDQKDDTLWPSWEDVVDIASDDDSESRYAIPCFSLDNNQIHVTDTLQSVFVVK